MTAGEAVVECMKIENVTRAFTVPGESFLAVLDALEGQESIELIVNRHEGGAGFMAEGYARSTGKVGVAMATRGVGAANISIAVHTAFQDSTPMVVFLGQVKREFLGREGFQEVNFDHNFNEIAKWTTEIRDSHRVPELVQKAFRVAQTGRPGPVIVSLPEDMLTETTTMNFGPPTSIPAPAPSTIEVETFQRLFGAAKKPIVIAGGGVSSSEGELALRRFVEKFKLPLVAGFRRQGIIDNDHEAYIGHMALPAAPTLVDHFKEADLVIAIGTRLSEATSQDYTLLHWDQTLIHIDIDESTIGKVYPPDLGIVSHAVNALQAFTDVVVERDWSDWQKVCRKSHSELMAVEKDDSIYSHVMETLNEELDPNAVITCDAGNFATWLHNQLVIKDSHLFLGPTNGAMGYGIPSAIGAKIAEPHRTVVSFNGDGGGMMTIQEIETSVRHKAPIIILLFDNQNYGTIRMHQEMYYPDKVIGTALGEVDFAKVAEGMGAIGMEVKSKDEFLPAFQKAIQQDRTVLIDIKCFEENYVANRKTYEDVKGSKV
ncbi:LOW QUALITY PROTEIN: thiamine pyrophosphate-requiring enzyme [Geomicrobium sp. JCM 19039]|nr:LOW QUALITY PROTEIN: thiamine pyrophosphate-requiring enzyme [Geomicrobium sp. JCM 19039]